jgi:hypothetical protein
MKRLLALASAATVVAWPLVYVANAEPSQSSGSQSDTVTGPRVTVRATTEPADYDWAKLQTGARVAYVSSGSRLLTGRMIDNDLHSVFKFSASDSAPTVIVELAQTERLHRIAAVFKAGNAKVDFYLLDQLPKNPRDLQSMKPFATVTDAPGATGETSVDFAPNNARYVALRWVRNDPNEPIEVAEISAFSSDPTDPEFADALHLADNVNSNTGPINPPPIPILSP